MVGEGGIGGASFTGSTVIGIREAAISAEAEFVQIDVVFVVFGVFEERIGAILVGGAALVGFTLAEAHAFLFDAGKFLVTVASAEAGVTGLAAAGVIVITAGRQKMGGLPLAVERKLESAVFTAVTVVIEGIARPGGGALIDFARKVLAGAIVAHIADGTVVATASAVLEAGIKVHIDAFIGHTGVAGRTFFPGGTVSAVDEA